jgi:hypothetical protein
MLASLKNAEHTNSAEPRIEFGSKLASFHFGDSSMNRTTTMVIAAIVLIIAIWAAVQYSGRMTPQPTEAPTPPATSSPAPAPGPTTPAPSPSPTQPAPAQ